MNIVYVVKGELIDHETIRLKEPVPLENGEIIVSVESKPSTSPKKRPIDWSKLVPREVPSFKPFTRDEIYDR